MEKLIFILERSSNVSCAEFAERLRGEFVDGIRGRGATEIVAHLADLTEQVRHAAPDRIGGAWETISGALSFWVDSLDGWREIDEMLRPLCAAVSAYLVTESVVQKAERDWPLGQPRPGVTQFSLAQRPAQVGLRDFYYQWQEVHSQTSFRLHPNRWSYVRHATARVLTPDAAPWDIIVLEHFRTLEDFTDDKRYLASADIVQQAMAELPKFVDLASYVSGPMNEYHFG